MISLTAVMSLSVKSILVSLKFDRCAGNGVEPQALSPPGVILVYPRCRRFEIDADRSERQRSGVDDLTGYNY
jgi:hypothetical protein